MNADTKRATQRILEDGWHQLPTLDEHGWPYLYANGVAEWEFYELYLGNDSHPAAVVSAKDNETAVKAFKGLFRLDEAPAWEIVMKIVEYEVIESKGQ